MQLLKIRYYQVRRDLGVWVFIIAGAVGAFSFTFTGENSRNNLILTTAALLVVLLFHQHRRDIQFIRNYFGNSYQQMCLGYTLSILPISIALVLHSLWIYPLILHISVSLIPLLKPANSRSPLLLFLTKHIPAPQFEWISGLRQNFFILIPLVCIAIVLSPVKLFALVALFIINLIVAGFYTHFEPLIMLNPEQLPPKNFLKSKISFVVKNMFYFNVFILSINSYFQNDAVWFNLFFLFSLMLLAACSVCIKYARYQPNEWLAFSGDGLLLCLAIIVPYLLPLGIYIFFDSRKKAIQTLNLHLT